MKTPSLTQKSSGLFTALFLVLGTGILLAQEAETIRWESDYNKAVTMAKANNKPLFIHFYGDACPPCRLMETSVFTNKQVIHGLNTCFVPVKINVSQHQGLAEQFQVRAIPTDIALRSDGQLIRRRQGGTSADQFLFFMGVLLGSLETNPTNPAPNIAPASTAEALQTTGNPIRIAEGVSPAPPTPRAQEFLRDPFTKQPVIPAQAAPMVPPVTETHPAPDPATPSVSAPVVPSQAEPVAVNPVRAPETPPIMTPIPGLQQTNARPTTGAVGNLPAAATPGEQNAVREAPAIGTAETEGSGTTMVEVPLGLEGYCPVILNAEERWVPGNPAFYTMFRGHVFRFSSEDAMKTFLERPETFAPVAMGEDIVLMVQRNKRVYGNRKFGAWYKGRVFLFSSAQTLEAFAEKPDFYTEIALKYETAFHPNYGRF